MQRTASATSKAHKLGDLIEEAREAQRQFDALPDEARSREADKVSLELDRLLDGLRSVSPVALRKSAHKLVKMIRHLHTGLRRFYGLAEDERTGEGDELARRSDRLVCAMAGLDPDEVSVEDFEI